MSTPSPPPPPAPTLRRRYGYDVCLVCGFAVEYCGCAREKAGEHTAQDGDESGLRQRIIEVVSKRGAR